jgi:hypothetical protein
MLIYISPLWAAGLLLCWIPWLIAKDKGGPAWGWLLFGIVCLPLAVVFAILEKPPGERRRYGAA